MDNSITVKTTSQVDTATTVYIVVMVETVSLVDTAFPVDTIIKVNTVVGNLAAKDITDATQIVCAVIVSYNNQAFVIIVVVHFVFVVNENFKVIIPVMHATLIDYRNVIVIGIVTTLG